MKKDILTIMDPVDGNFYYPLGAIYFERQPISCCAQKLLEYDPLKRTEGVQK
jgi:hypothetical protein